MNSHRRTRIVGLAAVLAAAGCSSSDFPGGAAGSAGTSGGSGSSGTSGGVGGAGGSSSYVPPTCDQGCQDYFVGYALTDVIWFLWNSTIVGHPSGAQDLMGTCPLGGGAHITGTTSVSGDTNTADLVFDLESCASSEDVYELTFTGSVTMEGSFDSNAAGTDFAAVTFDAATLDASGVLHYYPDDDPAIDDTCPLRVAQSGAGDSFDISGKRCGRTFDKTSREWNGGNRGTGGTSGSGGVGGAGGAGGTAGASGSASCACLCPDGSDCTDATEPNPCGVDADGIPNACGCPVDC